MILDAIATAVVMQHLCAWPNNGYTMGSNIPLAQSARCIIPIASWLHVNFDFEWLGIHVVLLFAATCSSVLRPLLCITAAYFSCSFILLLELCTVLRTAKGMAGKKQSYTEFWEIWKKSGVWTSMGPSQPSVKGVVKKCIFSTEASGQYFHNSSCWI